MIELTYEAIITINNEKDREVYNQCIMWRQNIANSEAAEAENP